MQDSKGFTLVELLIVVFLVATMSTLAVGSYTDYRRNALVELGAEDLAAQIVELRDDVRNGDFGSDSEGPKCFGVDFEGGSVRPFAVNYETRKTWVGTVDGEQRFRDVGCLMDDGLDYGSFELDSQVMVGEVFVGDSSISGGTLTFVPPDGEVIFSRAVPFDDVDLRVVVQYGAEAADRYKRELVIDLDSLNIAVLPIGS